MKQVMWLIGYIALAAMIVAGGIMASAEVPKVVNYQGRLTATDGTPYTGNKLIKFTLYNSSGGEIWTSGFVTVSCDEGLFNSVLGQTPQPAIPTSIWSADTAVTLAGC